MKLINYPRYKKNQCQFIGEMQQLLCSPPGQHNQSAKSSLLKFEILYLIAILTLSYQL